MKTTTKVLLVGAGELGSRHLQALAAVKFPLDIHVHDLSAQNLEKARGRYLEVSSTSNHSVKYSSLWEDIAAKQDFVIVATRAQGRWDLVNRLFQSFEFRGMILEKLLFDRLSDYDAAEKVISQFAGKIWVNCPRRVVPFYRNLKDQLGGAPARFNVVGSNFGLGSSFLHFLDYFTFLSSSDDFNLDFSRIDRALIPSRRMDSVEITGTGTAAFGSGSFASVTSLKNGKLPIVVTIESENLRAIIREREGLAWVSSRDAEWRWAEVACPVPPQSRLTTELVTSLIQNGTCGLTEFGESLRIHKPMVEAFLDFLKTVAFDRAAINCARDAIPFT